MNEFNTNIESLGYGDIIIEDINGNKTIKKFKVVN